MPTSQDEQIPLFEIVKKRKIEAQQRDKVIRQLQAEGYTVTPLNPVEKIIPVYEVAGIVSLDGSRPKAGSYDKLVEEMITSLGEALRSIDLRNECINAAKQTKEHYTVTQIKLKIKDARLCKLYKTLEDSRIIDNCNKPIARQFIDKMRRCFGHLLLHLGARFELDTFENTVIVSNSFIEQTFTIRVEWGPKTFSVDDYDQDCVPFMHYEVHPSRLAIDSSYYSQPGEEYKDLRKPIPYPDPQTLKKSPIIHSSQPFQVKPISVHVSCISSPANRRKSSSSVN